MSICIDFHFLVPCAQVIMIVLPHTDLSMDCYTLLWVLKNLLASWTPIHSELCTWPPQCMESTPAIKTEWLKTSQSKHKKHQLSEPFPMTATYRKAVLRNWDTAGLHNDTHTLVDAGCKSVWFICSLTFVPPGTPDTISTGEQRCKASRFPLPHKLFAFPIILPLKLVQYDKEVY